MKPGEGVKRTEIMLKLKPKGNYLLAIKISFNWFPEICWPVVFYCNTRAVPRVCCCFSFSSCWLYKSC